MKNNYPRLLLAFLIFAFLFSMFTVFVSSDTDLHLSARSAALYEPETKNFIYKKNFDHRLPMASTTKIMTALLALEMLDGDRIIKVDDRAIGVDGSSIYLEKGEELTAEDLIYALMLASANDAAEAIAYEISGDIDSFSTLMNERAYEIGARDTNFKNPHGLDAGGHYTTAHDLSIISAEALSNPKFREISSTYKKTFESNIKTRTVVNHNKLLKMYDGCIGVKTGYTQLSGRSLVGAAEKDGLTLISVTIDAPNDWSDHKTLLNYGFDSLKCVSLIKEGDFKREIPVLNGITSTLTVTNDRDVKIICDKNAPYPKEEIKMHRYFTAPVKKGDKIGKIIYTINGKAVGETDIVACDDITKKNKFNLPFGIFQK